MRTPRRSSRSRPISIRLMPRYSRAAASSLKRSGSKRFKSAFSTTERQVSISSRVMLTWLRISPPSALARAISSSTNLRTFFKETPSLIIRSAYVSERFAVRTIFWISSTRARSDCTPSSCVPSPRAGSAAALLASATGSGFSGLADSVRFAVATTAVASARIVESLSITVSGMVFSLSWGWDCCWAWG